MCRTQMCHGCAHHLPLLRDLTAPLSPLLMLDRGIFFFISPEYPLLR